MAATHALLRRHHWTPLWAVYPLLPVCQSVFTVLMLFNYLGWLCFVTYLFCFRGGGCYRFPGFRYLRFLLPGLRDLTIFVPGLRDLSFFCPVFRDSKNPFRSPIFLSFATGNPVFPLFSYDIPRFGNFPFSDVSFPGTRDKRYTCITGRERRWRQNPLCVTTEGYERRRRGNRDLYYYSLRVFYYAQIHTQSAIIEWALNITMRGGGWDEMSPYHGFTE